MATFEAKVNHLRELLDDGRLNNDGIANIFLQYRDSSLVQEQWNEALLFTNALGGYYIYESINHTKAFGILENYQPFVQYNGDEKQISLFYITYAEAATFMQYYKKSLDILDEGIQFMEKEKDSSLYEFGYAYLKAGENSDKVNKISQSVGYFEKAKKIFAHQRDTLMYLWAQNGLAQLYGKNGLYDRAEKARREVLEKGTDMEEYQVVAMARLAACNEANLKNDFAEELHQIRMALQVRNHESDIQGIVDILTLSYAVSTYARNGIRDTSDLYKRELVSKIGPHINNPFLETYYHLAMSWNALANNQLTQAERYAQKAHKGVKGTLEAQNIMRSELLLSNIYEKMNNLPQSLRHFKNYARMKDSVNNVTARRRFAFIQTELEAEKKDMEIARQKQDIKILDAQNKEKTYWMIFGGVMLVGGSSFLWLYRNRRFAKKEQELTEKYSQDLLWQQEREKEYIARELHDGVGQQLTLMSKKARDTKQKELLKLSQDTLEEVRMVAKGLLPPALANLGITGAIQQLIYTFDEKYNIIFTLEMDAIDDCFEKQQNVNFYRFVQEAMTNFVKHSQATEVLIEIIKKTDCVKLLITDNGIGFDYDEEHKGQGLGLKTMEKRIQMMNGNVQIRTTKNRGTSINAHIPITNA
ncbi:sensor histidine kinase [Muricauda sp. NFXS6]|uniref:tetratricopeptide repeat-containing sensor histidine kinase n=1 Tax=Allomuricauda sp. NFXS6 TaxID=2819094 RepID=UPI0032DE5FD6